MLYLERRHSTRVHLQAEARLARNGDDWHGTVLNIGLGGLYMIVPDTVPIVEHQTLQLGLVIDIGVLEIKGVVAAIRFVTGSQASHPDRFMLGLGIKFTALGAVERHILQSLLDGARDGLVAIRLTGLLIPQETADLLLEVDAPRTSVHDLTAPHPSVSDVAGAALSERRHVLRSCLALPVQMQYGPSSSPLLECTGQTVDIGLDGMRLRWRGHPDALVGPLVLRFSIPPQFADHRPKTTPDSPASRTEAADVACTALAEVVWTAPEPALHGDKGQHGRSGMCHVGLRFSYLPDDARLGIAGLAAQWVLSPGKTEREATTGTLVSESLHCRNRRGRRLALSHDHRQETLSPGTPVVIISPGYGETKREHIPLAYYFAAHGFHVLRYDHTNHVGDSEGAMPHSTLSGMRQDLTAVLDFAGRTWPTSPVMLIAAGLAGRVALKTLAAGRRVRLLVLLHPIVDVRATLVAAHQNDPLAGHLNGVPQGMMNVLGFNIEADHWLADAIEAGYADLHTTVQDAEQIHTPVILFSAENDTRTSSNSIEAVHTAFRSKSKALHVIPNFLPLWEDNPRTVRAAVRHLVACCLKQLDPLASIEDVREPAQRDITCQVRQERHRSSMRHHMTKETARAFWQDHLAHPHSITHSPDYWRLLDHICHLAGRGAEGGRIGDAGCGNGYFGVCLLVNHTYRRRHRLTRRAHPISYVGVDFILSALTQTRHNLTTMAAESPCVPLAVANTASLHKASLSLADLNAPLPFLDGQFHVIACNLVIGFLRDPLFTLRELMRVLSPQGRLIVTNLKPHADLSHIYQEVILAAQLEDKEARQLLKEVGTMKQGESDGAFRFFTRQELAMLLIGSGAQRPRTYPAFADQAYITVAEKGFDNLQAQSETCIER